MVKDLFVTEHWVYYEIHDLFLVCLLTETKLRPVLDWTAAFL